MFELSKRDSTIIKGIAIVLMFVHHFFCFPTWYVDNVSYPQLTEFAEFFRFPIRICVSIFAFLTGYLYDKNNVEVRKFTYSMQKISDLYIAYWCVFIPLFIFAIVLKNDTLSVDNFFMQLFGLTSNTMLFAWYVPFFVLVMFYLPIVDKCGRDSRIIFIITAFVATRFFSQIIFYNTSVSWIKKVVNDFGGTFPIVAIGYYFSHWKVFHKLQAILESNKKIVSIIVLLMVSILTFCSKAYTMSFKIGETYFKGETIDMSYSIDVINTPLFIWAIVNIIHMINFNSLMMIFEKMGKNSMMMWFVSCAFFSNSSKELQPFLYLPHNPFLVIVWGCLLTYVISIPLNICSSNLCKIKNKLFNSS